MRAPSDSLHREAVRDITLAVAVFVLLFIGVGVVWNTPPTVVTVVPHALASSSAPEVVKSACLVPDNPYSREENAYGGWEWGESGNICEGIESRFLAGCYDYLRAETRYYQCLSDEGAKPSPLVLDNRY